MKDKTKYYAYINSPEWHGKRKEVFKAKWYKCEACWISEWLQVHHGTYTRLYKEKIKDLFVLCWYCHVNLHDKYWTRDLLRATKAFIRWEELIPRKKKSKARAKAKKIKYITNIAIYWTFRLRRHLTKTKVQILIWRWFKEKTYKRFNEKWNQKKDEITISIK